MDVEVIPEMPPEEPSETEVPSEPESEIQILRDHFNRNIISIQKDIEYLSDLISKQLDIQIGMDKKITTQVVAIEALEKFRDDMKGAR